MRQLGGMAQPVEMFATMPYPLGDRCWMLLGRATVGDGDAALPADDRYRVAGPATTGIIGMCGAPGG